MFALQTHLILYEAFVPLIGGGMEIIMKITWLGQAGLYVEFDKLNVMIDPYLTNSVAKVNPANYRRYPVDESVWEYKPDVMIFTHDHLDHFDPETAPVFLEMEHKMTVLSPTSVYLKAREHKNGHNYVEFNPHTRWTQAGVRFYSVKATHSDPFAIGVVIEEISSGKKLYVTGDTLYNSEIFKDIPNDIYAVFLPINGVGNNMNMVDAADFAKKVGAKYTVPLHFGLFDELDPSVFECKGRVIPIPFKEIQFTENENDL